MTDTIHTPDRPLVYDNRSLFSDYYLRERLSDHVVWSEDVTPAFQAARQLYLNKREMLDGLNEAQTEEEFIKPLLRDVLGFEFEVQTAATRQGRLNRPDYALFTRSQAKTEAQRLREQEAAYYARAAAVADAKYWGRPLDRQVDDPRDELSNANPSFQIVNYLVATGVDWGMLTNGELWRLYYARARSRVDTYFEVDLARMLESGDPELFRYFYLFFRAPAFERDPQTDQSFLEAVHEGSVNYGTELEKRLKDVIFEQIFVHLATGFLEYRRTNGGVHAETHDSLNEIYQGTLRLLYRLLFLLHAEARGLLPVDDRHGYYRYSLTRIKRDVAGRRDRGVTLSTVSDDLWNDLAGLFRIIDRGDPALNVPQYNGGLFRGDDPKNAFLNTHRIPDAYLAPALDLLVREHDPQTGEHRFIDYKTLNVEQLGSIYEGLLEFHLETRDSRPVLSSVEGLEIDADQSPISDLQSPVYLVNEKGERKATGSYYTPHYIVEYIVEHTLGPVLEERADRFCELMAEIEPQRERLAEVEAKLAEDPNRADAWVTRWKNEKLGLTRELERLEREAFEALLGVRVCDPAMGSGHFLVYAADWLAEHLIAVLNEFPDNPVLRRIAGIRQQIVDELTRQGIAVDAERLKDTNLLKRMVMKRCIYGVDLNPMATELAKLSLWLDSFTVGAPLSFLDHHLKVGNSLIGAQVEEVRQALEAEDTGQMHMFGGPFAGLLSATELMRDVAARTDATFEEVEQSAEKYAAFEDAMLPYKRVLDLWVSRHFGNQHAEEFLRFYGHEALQAVADENVDLAPEYREAVKKARALWTDKRFFHWELEFPEVFVDLEKATWKDNSGFEVMIGNPPYGAGLSSEKPFLKTSYTTAEADYDTYTFFIEKAIDLLRVGGMHSFIVPNMWLTLELNEKLRRYILASCTIERLLETGRVFEDAVVETAIPVMSKRNRLDTHDVNLNNLVPVPAMCTVKLLPENVTVSARLEMIANSQWQVLYDRDQTEWWSNEFARFDYYLDQSESQLVDNVRQNSCRLGDLAEIVQGLTAYDRYQGQSAEIIRSRAYHADYRKDDTHKKFLQGSDVDRYQLNWSGEWISYGPWLAAPRDPKYFRGPRLLFREVTGGADRPLATYTDQEFYYGHSVIPALITETQFDCFCVLAIANSKLLAWYNLHTSPNARKGAFPKMNPSDVAALPIRHIEFTAPARTRAALVEEGRHLYQRTLASGEPAGILSFVAEQLAHEPERADVVHDLLAYLAKQMIDLHKDRQRVETALDPFKFLNRGVDFVKFTDAFAEEIKYGERVTQTSKVSEPFEVSGDLATDHHDIGGLRLVPLDDGRWELQVQLKLRDPAEDWQAWQYDESGNTIARVWAPAYHFDLAPEKARYYQHAFRVLDQFANARSFPGGYTRTTAKKLQLAKVPAYDPAADLTPLVDLSEELAGVQNHIARTDTLIDQIVYRLYGLTEEEIAVVEGHSRK